LWGGGGEWWGGLKIRIFSHFGSRIQQNKKEEKKKLVVLDLFLLKKVESIECKNASFNQKFVTEIVGGILDPRSGIRMKLNRIRNTGRIPVPVSL
jgi:hypothetical protein